MELKQDSTVVRRAPLGGSRAAPSVTTEEWWTTPEVRSVVDRLPDVRPRTVARAPIPLDVLGGLADYTGALTLQLPLEAGVLVAVQRRDDDQVVIERSSHHAPNGCPSTALPVSEIAAAQTEEELGRLSATLAASGGVVERCVAGVVSEVLRAGLADRDRLGVTVAVGGSLDGGAGDGGPIAAAVLTALAGSLGLAMEPSEAALLCQHVENRWLDVPAGLAVGAGAISSHPRCVNEHQCDSNQAGGRLPLPEGLALIGLCSGAMHERFADKYRRARTATFMGRFLINRIIEHDGVGKLRWDGHLSRISVSDYVRRFRDRIPTSLKGREFLERYGETGDPLTRVEPGIVYRIRSRTEHHIYEHGRSRQFVEGLARFVRGGDRSILDDVGRLMYGSHWSYGQRCGLGSIETDALVTLIRDLGKSAGVHGARISGRGCGGVVAVLMDDTERAMQAVQQACEAYHERSGLTVRVLGGSSPGAMIAGARTL